MRHNFTLAFVIFLLAGCHSDNDKVLTRTRLKKVLLSIPALTAFDDNSLMADGIWIPEPDDSAHALAFPEQTTISCNKGEKYCMENEVTFLSVANAIQVKGPDLTLWEIKSWDKNSLLAEYGPFLSSTTLSDKCQKHVLSIVFSSQTVNASDIPTHGSGCETLKETTSYRLARGWFVIDTSPNNNAIKDDAAK
jgi:hypothetical protein